MLEERKNKNGRDQIKTKGQLENDKKKNKFRKKTQVFIVALLFFTFNDLFLKFVSNKVYFLFVFFSPDSKNSL